MGYKAAVGDALWKLSITFPNFLEKSVARGNMWKYWI